MLTPPADSRPVKVFCSYAHEDARHLARLRVNCRMPERLVPIESWYDGRTAPGGEWEKEISEHLQEADLILLLISPDFLNSEYCYEKELPVALARHAAGEARVIPIIVRPCLWQHTPLARLQVLPAGGKPVIEWRSRDRGWVDVAAGVWAGANEVAQRRGLRKGESEDSRRPESGGLSRIRRMVLASSSADEVRRGLEEVRALEAQCPDDPGVALLRDQIERAVESGVVGSGASGSPAALFLKYKALLFAAALLSLVVMALAIEPRPRPQSATAVAGATSPTPVPAPTPKIFELPPLAPGPAPGADESRRLAALRGEMRFRLRRKTYHIQKFWDNEEKVERLAGDYYDVVFVKGPVLFRPASYFITNFDREYSEPLSKFVAEVLDILDAGAAQHALFVMGRADQPTFMPRLQDAVFKYHSIEYLPYDRARNQFSREFRPRRFEEAFDNGDLPDLRAAFMQQMLRRAAGLDAVILEGDVWPKVSRTERNAHLILFVKWPEQTNPQGEQHTPGEPRPGATPAP